LRADLIAGLKLLGDPVLQARVLVDRPTREVEEDGDGLAGVVCRFVPEGVEELVELVGLAGSGVAEQQELALRAFVELADVGVLRYLVDRADVPLAEPDGVDGFEGFGVPQLDVDLFGKAVLEPLVDAGLDVVEEGLAFGCELFSALLRSAGRPSSVRLRRPI